MMSTAEYGEKIESIGALVDAYCLHLGQGSRHSLLAFLPLATALQPWRDRDPASITPAEWRAWLSAHNAPLAPSTRNLRYRQLRAIYNFPRTWLGVEGWHNPFAGAMWRRIAPTPDPPYKPLLTDAQVEALCRAPRTRRGRLLVRLLAERGRRLGEVLAATVGDLRDLEAGSGDRRVLVFRRTKAGREQFTVLPPALAHEVKQFCAEQHLRDQDRMFPITQQAARSIMTYASASIGLHLSPHDLRRAFASRLERQGVAMGTIQAMMGHSRGSRVTGRHYIAERSAGELSAIV